MREEGRILVPLKGQSPFLWDGRFSIEPHMISRGGVVSGIGVTRVASNQRPFENETLSSYFL